MPADSSSAGTSDDAQSKLSCLSCLLCRPRNQAPREGTAAAKHNESGGVDDSPPTSRHIRNARASVYVTALQTGKLTADELAAIKELEEAADAAQAIRDSSEHNEKNGRESVYYDASDHLVDDWAYLREYAPARVPNCHKRASCTFDQPKTLLAHASAGASVQSAKKEGVAPAPAGGRRRLSSVLGQLKKPAVRVEIRGYPGELTEEELQSCQRFRSELDARSGGDDTDGKMCREIVDSLHEVEEEPYALCRFLRARKFDVDAVLEMLGDGVEAWKEGKRHNFYPDPNVAIGAPISVLRTQYPMLYFGIAKNGCPVSYFKSGRVSVEGVECVTTLDRLPNLAWHQMMYNFKSQIAKAQAVDPDVVRCEAMTVCDLKGLSASALNARTLEVLKAMVKVNQCFPEVLNCMVILNAPGFFSFSWRIIKRFLDARTAAKITIFADEKQGAKWLHDRIDKKELLSDYGGYAESFDEVMQMQGDGVAALRRIVELSSVPAQQLKEVAFDLSGEESVDVQVFTRSVAGADVSFFKDDALVKEICLQSASSSSSDEGESKSEPEPYCTEIASSVKGPGKFRLVIKPRAGSGTDHFLLIGKVN